MIGLLHASALGNYHTIVSLMILQIEIVGGVSGSAEGVISVVGQSHRKAVVGENVSVYVVRRRGHRAQGGWTVYHSQLCSACAIDGLN